MANDAIKGIMIKYGADDSDFIAGQKGVNNALKQNKATASALDKQFKETFDTNDITPLIKEQKYLTVALDASKDKASLLEYELSQISQEADNFDPTKYAKLEQQLSKSHTESAKLEKSLSKVNQNINAINTGNLDEMSADFQKSAESAGELNSGMDGLIDTVQGVDMSVGGLLKTVSKMSPTVAIATTAVTALGGALFATEKSSNTLNQTMMRLAPTVEATGSSMNQAVEAYDNLYVKTGDVEGATTAVNTAMSIYGDSINTVAGLTTASASLYQIQAQGIMDIADASKVGASAVDDFGASNLEANAVIQASEDLMAEYPGMVDDIGDSFKEFGDTLAMMGYTASEAMTLFSVSMELGAKNTDEVANSLNELFIRVSEGGTEVESALALIGMSIGEVQTMFQNGQGPEAMAEIVFGLHEVSKTTNIATASSALFGTMGEEFVTPMILNQTEKLTQLETTYRLNQQATSQLSALMAGNLLPAMETVGASMGLTAIEVQNLAFKFQEGGFSALTMTEKMVALTAGVMTNGEAMGLSAQQSQVMHEKMLVLTSSTASLSEKFAVLDGAMVQFMFSGVLTEEQMASLTGKINEQVGALQSQYNQYMENGGATGYLTQQIWDNYGALMEQSLGLDQTSFSALSFDSKMQALSGTIGLNTRDSKDLTSALETLASETATTTEKTEALRDGLQILMENGYQPNLESLSRLIPLLSEFAGGMDGSTLSANELTGEFAGMGKELDPTNESLETYIKRLEDSKSPLDKAKEKSRDTAEKFGDLGQSAETAAGQVDELNKALQTNATLPPPQSAPAPQSAPSGYMVQSPVNPMAFSTPVSNSVGAVSKPTFNATINISGSTLNAKEQYQVIKSAFDDLWFSKGRLL